MPCRGENVLKPTPHGLEPWGLFSEKSAPVQCDFTSMQWFIRMSREDYGS